MTMLEAIVRCAEIFAGCFIALLIYKAFYGD